MKSQVMDRRLLVCKAKCRKEKRYFMVCIRWKLREMEAKERGRKEPFIHLNNESFIKTYALYSHLSTDSADKIVSAIQVLCYAAQFVSLVHRLGTVKNARYFKRLLQMH